MKIMPATITDAEVFSQIS